MPVSHGLKTLKEAVDSAFEAYLADYENSIYCIGSVVGPHPFPLMVRDFQRVVGIEAREQFQEMTGSLPAVVTGLRRRRLQRHRHLLCVPGDPCRAGRRGAARTRPRARRPCGYDDLRPRGIIHGFKCYLLQNEDGSPAPVYSCASGLDYPGVGPEHSYLKDTGRVQYVTCSDDECRDAFFKLSRQEGIIPALESAHAVAYALQKAREMRSGTILVNLSGRGDKDLDYVLEHWGTGEPEQG